jgi:hypothetical protein
MMTNDTYQDPTQVYPKYLQNISWLDSMDKARTFICDDKSIKYERATLKVQLGPRMLNKEGNV